MVNIKGEHSFGLERLESPKKKTLCLVILFEIDHLADNSWNPNPNWDDFPTCAARLIKI